MGAKMEGAMRKELFEHYQACRSASTTSSGSAS